VVCRIEGDVQQQEQEYPVVRIGANDISCGFSFFQACSACSIVLVCTVYRYDLCDPLTASVKSFCQAHTALSDDDWVSESAKDAY
jgi:hypothetical protein